MMKKLLMLACVLGIASMASAGLQIAVGGVAIDEITLRPSDVIELQIMSDGAVALSDGYMMMFEGPGTYDAMNAHNYYNVGGVAEGMVVPIDNVNLFLDFAKAAVPVPSMPLNTLMADKILFHCDAEFPVTIILTALGSYGNVDMDTIIIHQKLETRPKQETPLQDSDRRSV
jgi:hypothetical protein